MGFRKCVRVKKVIVGAYLEAKREIYRTGKSSVSAHASGYTRPCELVSAMLVIMALSLDA